MRISVALAYYNGGQYIKEQLDSIRKQLGENDEVIISVDAADDGSLEYLNSVAREDRRLHILEGPGLGVVKNFEYAIMHCTKDVIFLADQDDIWTDDKVRTVMHYFKKTDVKAILHNAELVDENGDSLGKNMFVLRKSNKGILHNLIRNSYVGCCMAFRRELLPLICPIPDEMYMHDYWIGTIAELNGGVGLIRRPLLKYRRHGANVTQMEHGRLKEMVKKRINMLKCLHRLKTKA